MSGKDAIDKMVDAIGELVPMLDPYEFEGWLEVAYAGLTTAEKRDKTLMAQLRAEHDQFIMENY